MSPTQQLDATRGRFSVPTMASRDTSSVRSYKTAEDKMDSLFYAGLGEQRAKMAFRRYEGFAANRILR
jgi:hypothetical protein